MDFALNNLQRLICHKIQPTKQPNGISFLYRMVLQGLCSLRKIFAHFKEEGVNNSRSKEKRERYIEKLFVSFPQSPNIFKIL